MSHMAAVVLAAGKGTRMKSDKAKVLHAANGRPLAFFPIRAALALDCSPVVAVVGHQAPDVEKELAAQFPGAPLKFALQAEQLGTGHAVMCAQEQLKGAGSVLILYGDTPLLTVETLTKLVAAKQGSKLALLTARPKDPKGYGRIVRNPKGEVVKIVEEKDCSAEERGIGEINAGIYLVDGAFLFEALGSLGKSNAQGEYYLTDIVEKAGGAVAVEASETEVSGVNDKAQLAWSAAQLRERRNAALMKAGVTIQDPAVTYVEEGVEVGADTVLEPMVSLRGKTRVGAGCEIGQGCVIVDSEIADGVKVLPYSHFEGVKVLQGAVVGPFARLRPGAQVGEQAHVGNFVELKKTVLGKGSKANHLSYLGDATIGEGCNIGAGTITCNYDGVNKHQTIIEDGAFVGSDSQLVAPVRVGKKAWVGSGTTVREDVPAGDLAVSAGKQRNIEGWVEKKAPKKASKK